MKTRLLLIATAAMTIVSCSDTSELTGTSQLRDDGQVQPITFSTFTRNRTRAVQKLQDTYHYNFGIWGYKENATENQLIMDNYLVGYCDGASTGYSPEGSETWASVTGSGTDQKSPWFYDVLGNKQYTYTGNQYISTGADDYGNYKSAKEYQFLTYWDKAYAKTRFWYYAPYRASGVTFDYNSGSPKITVSGDNIIHDGYVNPLNTTAKQAPDFLYGTKAVEKASYGQDVATLSMTHGQAQVLIAFYSDANIYKYRAEIIDLTADMENGTSVKVKNGLQSYETSGVQANPVGCTIDDAGKVTDIASTKTTYLTDGKGMVVDFSNDPATVTPGEGGSATNENLRFRIPTTAAPNNITNHSVETVNDGTHDHLLIPQKVASGETQKYAYSPTIYNAVAQPQDFKPMSNDNPTAGFMFHVSFRFLKNTTVDESAPADYKVEHEVYNAKVYVPPYVMDAGSKKVLTQWQPNKRYIYIFRLTTKTNGTTDPTDPDNPIDPDDPTPDPGKALPAIVIDSIQVSDILTSTNAEFATTSEGTSIPPIPVTNTTVDPGYSDADL